ncbi:MAG: PrsW family intramembrane metalloprotease, partial [Bacillati bacterium ANGP1]
MEAPSHPAFGPMPSDLPKWQNIFLVGLLLWILSVVVTGATGNVNMVPTVVLLGSFLVPVTAVVWYLDHYESPELTLRLVVYTFIVGGVLGTLAASVLESWLRTESFLGYAGVGLIEEFAKLAALMFVARRLPYHSVRDGIVLGATVGFGFGALESSGYALTSLITIRGPEVSLSLGNLVFTELLRG